ncbi:MAG TPA: DMT family transporter [Myxococcaceae bacterium]|nr:DMT family transporter [Myxococcaceae bacterium]
MTARRTITAASSDVHARSVGQSAGRTRGGLGYMALSAFFFSIMALLVRVLGERLPSSQIVLARSVAALAMSWLLLRRAGVSPWGNHRPLLVLRGLFGFGALVCSYWSLVHMPLADATVLQYTNPVFTALLAALLLREPLRGADLVSVVISLLGVVLVARPRALFGGDAVPLDPRVVGVSLLGAMCSAAAYTVVRKGRRLDHPLVVVFWFPLVATPLAIPPAIRDWVNPTPREWVLLLGVAVATQAAQVFLTHGLHREPAGRATAISYLQIVFAAAWGLLFLGEIPDPMTIGGAALIGGSVIALAAWPKRELVPNAEE